jgi:hypothetical protein
MRKYQKDIIGEKHNHLTIVEDLGMMIKEGTKNRQHYVKCICDCEERNEVIDTLNHVRTGHTKYCASCAKIARIESRRKYNEYYVYENIVFVKFTNVEEYFICDLEDWENLKHIPWYKEATGYAVNKSGSGKVLKFHRLVMNCPDDMVVDHKYQVSLGVVDNRKSNLVICTKGENNKNLTLRTTNKSGHAGVTYVESRKKWSAYITVNKIQKNLGYFNTYEDAVKAREAAEIKYNFNHKGNKS